MTCEHCQGADKLFDFKGAQKELKRYRKKGPRKTSSRLIQGVRETINGSTSLLDIGGGIGAVHIELIKSGVTHVTDIDASNAYIELAKEESSIQNVSDQIEYLAGDFLDHIENVREHDIAVLDKVVCCYPHMHNLLSESLKKTRHTYAIVYPKSHSVGRIFISLGNFIFWIKRNPFRVFLHSNNEIRGLIEKAGFKRTFYKSVFPWNVEVYNRIN